ncbi:sensor histidine kinase [Desulfotignum balticum]|jgi:signal transduction histidine kinase|uniref:sensor histidine kinase n=1 Tax=Desulfotignum balticum TaxID=115781 RepID=UPI000416AB9D|nr:HAMP domain-containing sensor histidine kinase [Desulfotignum balticum]
MNKIPDSNIKTEILIHDLKVPISVINAGARSLLDRQDTYGPLTEKQIKVLNRIVRNTLATQRLVNDVLELGRSREGVIVCSQFSVAALVAGVLVEVFDLADPNVADAVRKAGSYAHLQQVIADAGVTLDFQKDTWRARVCLDAAKVRQILRNLVTNAFKHRTARVDIRGVIADGCLTLWVKDDGRGIPHADHQRIFNTYFTTGGSIEDAIESHGLGLAGVMVLLKDMGGQMMLTSDAGRGAEFRVSIPLS